MEKKKTEGGPKQEETKEMSRRKRQGKKSGFLRKNTV